LNGAKKLVFVGGIIGIGHLLSLALVPILQRFVDAGVIANIAQIDASMVLVVSLLGFGITVTTTRDVATSKDWSLPVQEAFDARVALSFILFFVGIVGYSIDDNQILWLILIASPLIALNLDFVLYGLGLPVKAALASFIRLSMPVLLYVGSVVVGYYSHIIYMICVLVFTFFSSFFVLKSASYQPTFKLSLLSLKRYRESFFVGLGGFALSFQRFGILAFYAGVEENTVYLFFSLKAYMAFVAIRRLFIQTFYKQLLNEVISKNINRLVFISAVIFFVSVYLYSQEMSELIFNQPDGGGFLILTALLILAGSLFSCSDAQLMLMRGDRKYVFITVSALVVFGISFAILIALEFETPLIASLILSEALLGIGYWASAGIFFRNKKNAN